MFTKLFGLSVLGRLICASPTPLDSRSTTTITRRQDTASTFYIVDNDSSTLANAVSDPSGIFFGANYNSPTLFSIDSSTGILLTADPGETVYDSYIEAGSYSPVQISTTASTGFLKCSIVESDQLSCSVDDIYTEFVLDSGNEDSTDYTLYLVESGTTSKYARTATLGVQYSSGNADTTIPSKFYLSTSMGWAIDFGANSGIYAGTDYAKESAGSIYSLDNSTGYLRTSTSDSTSPSSGYAAYIDTTTTEGYSMVQLVESPESTTLSPLICSIATDGTNSFSCTADGFEELWLDLGVSTSGDYTLYIAKSDSTGKGTERVEAQIVATSL